MATNTSLFWLVLATLIDYTAPSHPANGHMSSCAQTVMLFRRWTYRETDRSPVHSIEHPTRIRNVRRDIMLKKIYEKKIWKKCKNIRPSCKIRWIHSRCFSRKAGNTILFCIRESRILYTWILKIYILTIYDYIENSLYVIHVAL